MRGSGDSRASLIERSRSFAVRSSDFYCRNHGGVMSGRALPAPVQPAGIKGFLTALIMAGLTFGAVRAANASTATITVKGTVVTGEDNTGVFGFAPSTNLAP